jgi:hypothetical protein
VGTARQGGLDLGSTTFRAGELDRDTSVLVQSQKSFGGVIVNVGQVSEITSAASRFYNALPSHTLQQLNIPMDALA